MALYVFRESSYISAPPVPLEPERIRRKKRKPKKQLIEDESTPTKYQVIDAIPAEMKQELKDYFQQTKTEPNHYYPEDVSNEQAIKRYLGRDTRNYSIRIAAIDDDRNIKALIDAIPLDINEGQLHCYAAYVYGDPTSDKATNQEMIEHLISNAISNPDRGIQWIVFNDLSKSENKKWINALETFGFIQPYRFVDPAFKDTVVEVHVLRTNAGSKYPITMEDDVRNSSFEPISNSQEDSSSLV